MSWKVEFKEAEHYFTLMSIYDITGIYKAYVKRKSPHSKIQDYFESFASWCNEFAKDSASCTFDREKFKKFLILKSIGYEKNLRGKSPHSTIQLVSLPRKEEESFNGKAFLAAKKSDRIFELSTNHLGKFSTKGMTRNQRLKALKEKEKKWESFASLYRIRCEDHIISIPK